MISVIDYGAGNIQSVIKAFHHIGCAVQVTADPEVIRESKAAILPGVGAFGDSMNSLKQSGLVQPVLDFIESGKPFLGICLVYSFFLRGVRKARCTRFRGPRGENPPYTSKSRFKGTAYGMEFSGTPQPKWTFFWFGGRPIRVFCALLLFACRRSERCLINNGIRCAD